MRNIAILVIFMSTHYITTQHAWSQQVCERNQPCAGRECYDLTENQAMDIMTNQLSVLGDPPYVWEVDKVGYGLTCLDYCEPGSLRVAPGVFKNGKCTYRVENNDPVNLVGDCTTIVLERKNQ